jgi:ArsR family transcriptional regulator, arsenate/arsenite/antimonite-responsive transcriptional repressor
MRRLTSRRHFDNNGNMETKHAVSALSALAQETRLSIFRLLVEAGPEGLPAGTIAEKLKVAAATLSFHLKELSHAQLIAARQEGRFIYYSADFEQMAALMSFLTNNCCKGMPQECLTVVETALGRCCGPAQSKRKTSRSSS